MGSPGSNKHTELAVVGARRPAESTRRPIHGAGAPSLSCRAHAQSGVELSCLCVIYNPGVEGSGLPLDPQRNPSRITKMSSLGIPETPQVKLVEEWHRGFNERNLDLLAKPLHKDFRRYTYPQSIGQAVQTKEEWLERFAGVIKFSTDFEVSYPRCHTSHLLAKSVSQSTLHSAIEAPGKVIIHVCLHRPR